MTQGIGDNGVYDPDGRWLIFGPKESLAVGIGFLLVALAAWLFRLSMIVRKTERFPPPGTPVIRTTEVLTGKLARKKANMGYMLAALIAWAGVLGAWALWKITESFAAM